MHKKSLGTVCFLSSVLILISTGCSQKTTVQDTTIPATSGVGEETQKPESEQPTPEATGKVTDTQCIDVIAHQFWAVQLMEVKHDITASLSMTKKAEDLQKHYGISDNDFDNVCNAKVGSMDFMDNLEKRMQTLGFVIK
ncbi:hypothetical protein COT40_00085 [Candidatus Peregrinibacteria bacterium CG08_land_8_20_14_0_20_41_10]|nr:MAG: hypothetical protein AUJ78_00995 [Candidatus Peregrinibacteria bacterium CG1_02_41_10]PIS32422.1 MAG: hypothetical protein COT40_00085 [Candidatus Peregrinibacteria bacterium CG08_land_8_20_14_0_20_41_10]